MASYHIIGGDGKEYGPYPLEKIRELLAENRLRADSQIRPEGGDWTQLGHIPELATPPATQPMPQPLPPPQGQPAGTAAHNPQPYIAPYTPQQPQRPNNTLAVVGMVLGISSIVLGCCCGRIPFVGLVATLISLVTPIAGLICSLIGRSQIKKSGGTQGGEGMALAGIITSGLYLLLIIGLGLGAGLALFQFGRP